MPKQVFLVDEKDHLRVRRRLRSIKRSEPSFSQDKDIDFVCHESLTPPPSPKAQDADMSGSCPAPAKKEKPLVRPDSRVIDELQKSYFKAPLMIGNELVWP